MIKQKMWILNLKTCIQKFNTHDLNTDNILMLDYNFLHGANEGYNWPWIYSILEGQTWDLVLAL